MVLLSGIAREHSHVSPYTFASSPGPTLGVEIELNLVDAETMALRSGVTPILEGLPAELEGSVKPELFQCYLEINTEICRDVAEVERDLTAKIKVVDAGRTRATACGCSGAGPTRSRAGRTRRSRRTSATSA